MVLLRDAARRPGRREGAGSAQAPDGADGEGEGGGGPQQRAPDVLPGRGGGGQEEDVHAPLQRGQSRIPRPTSHILPGRDKLSPLTSAL